MSYKSFKLEGITLKAVGGDIVGMGATGDSLYRDVTGSDHFTLIKTYLRVQLECELECYARKRCTGISERYGKKLDRLNDLGNEMIDAGIFESKYDKRTSWVLTEVYEY